MLACTGYSRRWIGRIVGALLFVAVIGMASDSFAQQRRGLFRRGTRVDHHAATHEVTAQEPQTAEASSAVVQPTEANYSHDWRRDPSYFPVGPLYPKFYGGFHSSHYSNLGVPSGDIGFRGNGVYWAPW